jgi:hypothetical protein
MRRDETKTAHSSVPCKNHLPRVRRDDAGLKRLHQQSCKVAARGGLMRPKTSYRILSPVTIPNRLQAARCTQIVGKMPQKEMRERIEAAQAKLEREKSKERDSRNPDTTHLMKSGPVWTNSIGCVGFGGRQPRFKRSKL